MSKTYVELTDLRRNTNYKKYYTFLTRYFKHNVNYGAVPNADTKFFFSKNFQSFFLYTLFRLVVTGIIPITFLLYFNLNIYLVRCKIRSQKVILFRYSFPQCCQGLKATRARTRRVTETLITTIGQNKR